MRCAAKRRNKDDWSVGQGNWIFVLAANGRRRRCLCVQGRGQGWSQADVGSSCWFHFPSLLISPVHPGWVLVDTVSNTYTPWVLPCHPTSVATFHMIIIFTWASILSFLHATFHFPCTSHDLLKTQIWSYHFAVYKSPNEYLSHSR